MSKQTIIFFLICMIVFLMCVVLYQQFVFRRGIQEKLNKISRKLHEILDGDTDEQVMVFTDNKVLMDLSGQINCLILDRQKLKTDYKRQEMSSKKMLSNISHDIKTPLTVILGYLEIIRLDHKDEEALYKVEVKAKQVMELINQFFTLAKLEAGDMNLEISRININELCRENILGFYDILMQKDFEVEIDIPEEDYFVKGNEESIRRILFNLITNAVRYGSDGKYLKIALYEKEAAVFIDVEDKGKGIAKEFAAHVFERLYTMEDSRNREVQGNGLGLTISKNLAVQMGGDILLVSEPGVRTIFTVKLKKDLI